MAKHLSELRHFPLFFYGQNYMLGVQSWIAVPFFWIGGPTVLMLRLPLAIINAAVATTVIVMLLAPWSATRSGPGLDAAVDRHDAGRVRRAPADAWREHRAVRVRPRVVGPATTALGLRRVAVRRHTSSRVHDLGPAGSSDRQLGGGPTIHWPSVARGGMAFAAVWLFVDLLKRTGGGSLTQEAGTIGPWLTLSVGAYLARLYSLLTVGLPELIGGHTFPLSAYGMNSTIVAGSLAAGLAFAVAVTLSAGRLLWILGRGDDRFRFRAASFQVVPRMRGARDVCGLRFERRHRSSSRRRCSATSCSACCSRSVCSGCSSRWRARARGGPPSCPRSWSGRR